MIVIQEYNPGWPGEFERIRTHLQEVLGTLVLRVDHVGSTSVPGLAAKDVIDVQVTVKELAQEINEKLVAAGYQYWDSISEDHLPAGEESDAESWSKLVFVQPEGQRRMNIHVRVNGSPNQRYSLLFRDYLRAHSNAAQCIETIKRELASRHPEDVDFYYAIKDPVYDLIWIAAREWSHQTGWQPG